MTENNLTIRLSLSGLQAVTSGMREISTAAVSTARSIGSTVLALAGVGGLGAAMAAVARTGVGLNARLEQAKLAIAAVQRQLNPDAFRDFGEAMKVADAIAGELKQKDLVDAFSGITSEATRAGLSIRQQVELVKQFSGALSGLGVDADRISRELLGVVSGNLGDKSLAATMLGISKEEMDLARQTGTLFDLLTRKLAAFGEASKVGQASFNGLWSSLKDGFNLFAQAAAKPIFEELKQGMKMLLDVDWEGVGKDIGDLIATGLAAGRRGDLMEFIGVAVGAGFEEGLERAWSIMTRMFSDSGGLWMLLAKLLARLGYGIIHTFHDALEIIVALVGSDDDIARIQKIGEAALEAEKQATAGLLPGVGTNNRDALRQMLSEFRASNPPEDVTELPAMTVRGPAEVGPIQGPMPLQRDMESFKQSFSLMLVDLQAKWGTWATASAEAFRSVFESSIQSISDGITGLIMATKTWGQALREIGISILTSVVQAIVQMGVRWIATKILMATVGKAIDAAAVAASLAVSAAHAAALTSLWSAPATLAATASFGAAAAMAPAAITAATGMVKATSLASMAFAAGGLTPGVPTLATVGERGPEFVVNADATRRNLAALEAINAGASLTAVAPSAGDPRPVQVHIFLDRDEWLRSSRDNIEAIAVDALRRHA